MEGNCCTQLGGKAVYKNFNNSLVKRPNYLGTFLRGRGYMWIHVLIQTFYVVREVLKILKIKNNLFTFVWRCMVLRAIQSSFEPKFIDFRTSKESPVFKWGRGGGSRTQKIFLLFCSLLLNGGEVRTISLHMDFSFL